MMPYNCRPLELSLSVYYLGNVSRETYIFFALPNLNLMKSLYFFLNLTLHLIIKITKT